MDRTTTRPDRAEIAALARKYAGPAPRYTSYPTAMEFHDGVGEAQYVAQLRRSDARADAPWSVYVHIPFCEHRCAFCACSAIGTDHGDAVAEPYVERLVQEMDLVTAQLPSRRRVNQLHWGGGTPTYLSPRLVRRLTTAIRARFDVIESAEIAVEVDPRVTAHEHVEALAEGGFNRISVGIQDFDPTVQHHIGREQSEAQTFALIEDARAHGFGGVNVDLVYGLPGQTIESLSDTIDRISTVRPDRVALYGYAHLPHIRSNQRAIDPTVLPNAEQRLELWLMARERLEQAGYTTIGMDHFALADDELAVATREGRLGRNFMGYTVTAAPDILGFGVTAIGNVGPTYVQNEKKLARYYRALAEGRLPIERGYTRNDEDVLRGRIIMDLMCCRPVVRRDVERTFAIEDFDARFAPELEALAPMIADGFVEDDREVLVVTERGRPFVRSIAATFDPYRQASAHPASAAV